MRKMTFLGTALLILALSFNCRAPAETSISSKYRNWGLENSNRSGIEAPSAWTLLRSNSKVVVAVLDTGVDLKHPYLKDAVSKFGWDFTKNTTATEDAHGHGTHIAGIIDAVSNQRALILPITYYRASNPGSVNLANTVKAIRYAVDHGAKIINYSGGGPEFSEDEYNALKYAEKHGVLVVAAAGNERRDTDLAKNYYYPASHELPNIISVMSLDIMGQPLASSNWGKSRVDVAAPGESIFSALPDKKAGYMSGTSQATAFVTGIAVMLLSENPKMLPKEVKCRILQSVDRLPQLKDKNATGGRVNAYSAMKIKKNCAPEPEVKYYGK